MIHARFRISRLTKLGNLLLGALTILLVITTLWAIAALHAPYEQLLKYTEIATDVQTGIRKPIDQYLGSGNAVMLAAAEKQLKATVETDFKALPEEAILSARGEASKLQKFLAGDLRAAGKLSGNEQGLLLQAEREMRYALSSLNDYAQEGGSSNPELALKYAVNVARMLEILNNVAHIRQNYLSTREASLKEQLMSTLEQAESQLLSLKSLPRLGLYVEESEDEFSSLLGVNKDSDQGGKEDKAEEPLSSLNNLLQRYSKELEHTEQIVNRAAEVDKSARDHVDAFIDSLGSVVQVIDSRFNTISSNVKVIVIVAGLLVLLMTGGLGFIQQQLTHAIQRLLPVFSAVAKGDLRQSVDLNSRFSEIDQLQNSANELRTQLSKLVSQIRQEAVDVDQLSGQLSITLDTIHNGTQTQVEHTEQSATAVNEMTASFREVADQAASASEASVAANDSVNEGQAVINSAIATIDGLAHDIEETSGLMNVLAEESAKIDSVRSVIETIAEQTNLLALNAAIEAARAGDQGRGFAVVADEVRQLAQRTTESTQEIGETIERLQRSSRSAVDTMNDFAATAQHTTEQAKAAGCSFREVVTFIDSIRDMTATIASATEEQAAVAAEVDQSIVQISDMSRQTQQAMHEAVSHNQRLAQMSTELLQSSQCFEL